MHQNEDYTNYIPRTKFRRPQQFYNERGAEKLDYKYYIRNAELEVEGRLYDYAIPNCQAAL